MLRRRIITLGITIVVVGCGDDGADQAIAPAQAVQTEELTAQQSAFGNNWNAASEDQRRVMAELANIQSLFHGATKAQVKATLGDATESGIDRFGEDVIRYELGDAPPAYGGGKYHLTFVFEEDVVVGVMSNAVSDIR